MVKVWLKKVWECVCVGERAQLQTRNDDYVVKSGEEKNRSWKVLQFPLEIISIGSNLLIFAFLT